MGLRWRVPRRGCVVASDAASYVNGASLKVDGGFTETFHMGGVHWSSVQASGHGMCPLVVGRCEGCVDLFRLIGDVPRVPRQFRFPIYRTLRPLFFTHDLLSHLST